MAYRACRGRFESRQPPTQQSLYTQETTLASITKYRLYTEPPSFEEKHYLLEARPPRAKCDRDTSPYGTPTRKTINNEERAKSMWVTYEEHTRVGP